MADTGNFELMINGHDRNVSYYDPETNPADAVICCHPGGGSGSTFLRDQIHPANHTNIIFFGPDAVQWKDGGTKWMAPGEDGMAVDFPDGYDDHDDITFISELIDYIQENHTHVERIWIIGQSSGGKMTWVAAADPDNNLGCLKGFGISGRGEPISFTWSLADDAKPTSIWFGGDDPGKAGGPGAKSFSDSVDDLESEYSVDLPSPTNKTLCGKTVKQRSDSNTNGGELKTHYALKVGHPMLECGGTNRTLTEHFQVFANFGMGT